MPWFGDLRMTIGDTTHLFRTLDYLQNRKVQDDAIKEFAQWVMSDVLGKYPDQKYVSRASAYGQTFQSDRQRRWFFAALRSGELQLPYSRTNTLRDAWQMTSLSTEHVAISNNTPYAGYVIGDGAQARMMQMIGWREVQQMVKDAAGQFSRFFDTVFFRYIG